MFQPIGRGGVRQLWRHTKLVAFEGDFQDPGPDPAASLAASADASTGSGGPQRAAPHSKGRTEKWGRGRSVIVADDEDIVRHLIQEVLQHDGFRVLPTENEDVTLALLACEDLPIGALIADYHLGRHSGLWLARRALEQQPDLRIVLMSGDLTVRSRVKSADLPAIRNVLIKPFGVRTLRRTLREALGDED